MPQLMPPYWSQSGMGCANCMGLGQDDSDGGGDDVTVDDPYGSSTLIDYPLGSTGTILSSPYNPIDTSNATLPASGAPITTTSPSSSLSSSEATALANLGAAWTKIFGNVIAPQTTITTPTGLQVSTPAGQTANLASVLGGASLLGTSATSWVPLLVVAGVGIGGLMLISSAMKK